MLARPSHRRSLLLLSLLLGAFTLGSGSSAAQAQRIKAKVAAKAPAARAKAAAPKKSAAKPGRKVERDLNLATVKVEGKEYVRTFRITSQKGFKRITDKNSGFRFFGGGGQYGEGFYLFANRADATKFRSLLPADSPRNVLVEVLMPKDMFKSVKKAMVLESADWGKNRQELNSLRLNNHILFGKWAPSPHLAEPAFEPMNGTYQLSVSQLGMPSILNKSIIREAK